MRRTSGSGTRRSLVLALIGAGFVLTPAIAAPGGHESRAQAPEETPTATATADPTVTPTVDPTVTATVEPTVTATATATATAEPTTTAAATPADSGGTAGFVLSQPAPAPAPTTATGRPVATVVVRIAGAVTKRGTRIRVLSVRAPLGASIIARCSGHCPKRTVRAQTSRRTIRLHAYERTLRPRTVLVLRVRVRGMIGRYTRLQIRGGKPPARRDACLSPHSARPVTC